MKSEDHDHENCMPPAVNWKCIWFTLVLSAGYWYLPPRNKWVLLSLLYFPYLALAWYDHVYNCARTMGPTYLALFYWWGKPPQSEQIQTYKNWCPKWKNRVLAIDLVVLGVLLAIAPSFLAWTPASFK